MNENKYNMVSSQRFNDCHDAIQKMENEVWTLNRKLSNEAYAFPTDQYKDMVKMGNVASSLMALNKIINNMRIRN